MDFPERQARNIINRHMWLAMGVGFIPIPLVDMVALIGLQLRMLRLLSETYHVPFYRDIVKKLVSSVLGGIIPTSLATIVGGMRLIPVLGPTIGVMSTPLFAAATTRAIGNIFMQHFESGGTFLDFEPATVRAHFRQEFEASQEWARAMREKRQTSETIPPNGSGVGPCRRSAGR